MDKELDFVMLQLRMLHGSLQNQHNRGYPDLDGDVYMGLLNLPDIIDVIEKKLKVS